MIKFAKTKYRLQKLFVLIGSLTFGFSPLSAQLVPAPDVSRALEIGVEDGFTLISVGDVIMSSSVSQLTDDPFREVVERLHSGDVVFGNFENTAIDFETFDGYPAPLFGGLRLRMHPDAVSDLHTLGFDIMSRSNNHTTDWGIEGLIGTSRVLDDVGIVHAGAGKTMGEARRGGFLETPKGRIGMVSMASSFMSMSPALDPNSGRMLGRPGLSSLSTTPHYFVTESELALLRRIRDEQPEGPVSSSVRVPDDDPEDELSLFGVRYKVGDRRGREYTMNQYDLGEILYGIRAAKIDSDFVIATIHAHNPGNWSDEAPGFLEELARSAIDSGADQFVGHGPHQLRGIEIYQGKPIFYSLGNFFFQVELQSPLSSDIYQNYDIDPDSTTDGEFLSWWMGNSFGDPIWYESVIAESRYEDGRVAEIKLYPVELGYELPGASRGIPRTARPDVGQKILETLQRLSQPYGTEIVIEDGIGVIRVAG